MVQLPDELSHKTKQDLITHNITRGHLLRDNKKYPAPPQPPHHHHYHLHHHLHHQPTVASVKLIQVSETLFFFY